MFQTIDLPQNLAQGPLLYAAEQVPLQDYVVLTTASYARLMLTWHPYPDLGGASGVEPGISGRWTWPWPTPFPLINSW